MSKVVRPINEWIIGKIVTNLVQHEGCTVEDVDFDNNIATIRDAFGFRYQLALKAISRADSQLGEFEDNVNHQKNTILATSKSNR